ncbi:hypothetical protein V8E53_005041 [Lactarius tabidus]
MNGKIPTHFKDEDLQATGNFGSHRNFDVQGCRARVMVQTGARTRGIPGIAGAEHIASHRVKVLKLEARRRRSSGAKHARGYNKPDSSHLTLAFVLYLPYSQHASNKKIPVVSAKYLYAGVSQTSDRRGNFVSRGRRELAEKTLSEGQAVAEQVVNREGPHVAKAAKVEWSKDTKTFPGTLAIPNPQPVTVATDTRNEIENEITRYSTRTSSGRQALDDVDVSATSMRLA